ncbi:uncharacterized protein A4U43_C10F18530 [Asparagus officinalis]|uniref:Uncharacterized protein n=1 Tax=Asparagus officinalis TaxID=4686 RepID=A0A5P1E439_ASPOF|nr:uncharacterized protein A4U43_C10F18530 [Asparagus officinalis]
MGQGTGPARLRKTAFVYLAVADPGPQVLRWRWRRPTCRQGSEEDGARGRMFGRRPTSSAKRAGAGGEDEGFVLEKMADQASENSGSNTSIVQNVNIDEPRYDPSDPFSLLPPTPTPHLYMNLSHYGPTNHHAPYNYSNSYDFHLHWRIRYQYHTRYQPYYHPPARYLSRHSMEVPPPRGDSNLRISPNLRALRNHVCAWMPMSQRTDQAHIVARARLNIERDERLTNWLDAPYVNEHETSTSEKEWKEEAKENDEEKLDLTLHL